MNLKTKISLSSKEEGELTITMTDLNPQFNNWFTRHAFDDFGIRIQSAVFASLYTFDKIVSTLHVGYGHHGNTFGNAFDTILNDVYYKWDGKKLEARILVFLEKPLAEKHLEKLAKKCIEIIEEHTED